MTSEGELKVKGLLAERQHALARVLAIEQRLLSLSKKFKLNIPLD